MKCKNLLKRSLALFLAVLMVSSMCGTAFAAELNNNGAAESETVITSPPPDAASPEPELPQENIPDASEGNDTTDASTPTEETTEEPVINNPSVVVPPDDINFGDGIFVDEQTSETDIIADDPTTITSETPNIFSEIMPFQPRMSSNSMEVMRFTWNGVEQIVKTNASDNISGCSWSCDNDGNFTIRFHSDGTFVLTKGFVDSSNVLLIGGGAGGENGYVDGRTCYGGDGGGIGENKNSPITINLNEPYTVTVGRGGAPATAGTASQFGSMIAAGGERHGGGAGGSGTASGGYGSNGGGGGAANSFFTETRRGNFSTGDGSGAWPGTDKIWGSCWNCGYNNGDGYGNGTYSDATACNVSGGGAIAGSGRGADPVSDWCPYCGMKMNPGQSGSDATAPGGGGGGGGAGTGWYRIWLPPCNQNSGSREWTGVGCNGGHGGDGRAEISGHAESGVEFTINKTSAQPEITDGSSCYDLANAQYAVYASESDAANDTNRLAVLTTDSTGRAYQEKVVPYCDPYYVKEVTAPKGFALDPKIYTASPSTENSITMELKDIPLNDPVSIEIYKIDAEGKKVPGTRLDGAEFTINYYDGYYEKETLPEQLTRHWVIKTVYNESAGRNIASLRNPDCFVSGDELYRDQFGKIIMPLGTIAVYESKAPEGYKIGDGNFKPEGEDTNLSGVYVAQITSDDSTAGAGLKGGHKYTMNEFLTKVSFAKQDEEGNYLAGARLSVQNAATGEIIEAWDTKAEPHVIEGKLLAGVEYKLVEEKAPNGYTIADPVVFTVDTNQTGEQVIIMTDKKTEVRLIKVNENGEPIKGAVLEVQDNNGKTIDKWTSDGTPHVIRDLPIGESYFFVEITPPAGYGMAEKIPFTITSDYNGIEVKMVDEKVSINTTAHDDKGNHEIKGDGNVKVVDTVEYRQLVPKTEYKLEGVLIDKATGKAIVNADGEKITASKVFTPDTPFGKIDVIFDVSAEAFAGKTIVVFETLYEGKKEIAKHTDIQDTEQTVYFPEIKTTATDENGKHITKAAAEVTITDVVEYSALVPGKEYTLVGTLMRQSTGKPLVDTNGNEVTSSIKFTPDTENGTVELKFVFDGKLVAGDKVVAFEKVTDGDTTIAVHTNINEEAQTVAIPKIETTATSNGSHAGLTEKNISIKDVVSYKGLMPNVEYILKAELMLQSANAPLTDASGNAIVKQITFTPDKADGEVEVEFVVDAQKLKGESIVVFETLLQDKIEVATHKDINDENQTIYFSSINTTATDRNGNKDIKPEGKIEIVDKVEYNNLIRGAKYELVGTLMDKETGEAVLNEDNQPITVTKQFTAKVNGSVEMVFTIDAAKIDLSGKSFVVFEQLNFEGAEIANHADIADEGQTVHFPKIKTTATDAEGNKDIKVQETVKIVDEVVYTNLIPDKEYTLTGTLMFKDTGKSVIGSDGHEVTSSVKFTPQEANGTVNMEFTVAGSILAGKQVVVFENLYNGEREVAVHNDLSDENQTVYIPDIKTVATIQNEHIAKPDDAAVLVDRIEYKGLIPGQEYVVNGVLMDKDTKKPAVIESLGENGLSFSAHQMMAKSTFTPETSAGFVDIIFKFEGKGLEGKTLVAFETLYNGEREIAIHNDLSDENQTIHFPKLRTTATDKDNNKHLVVKKDVIVKDVVHYENLLPNKTYIIKGVLMDKETNEPILDRNGHKVVSEAKLRLEAGDKTTGDITLEFKVDATLLRGKTIVVFENMFMGDREIAAHADINDPDQSVYVPDIKTTLTDAYKAHSTNTADETVLTDKVEYFNLIPGQEYTMNGQLMYKNECGKAVEVKDSAGNPITTTKTFTAEEANGFVEMTFTFNSNEAFDKALESYAGQSVVAYETLKSGDIEIVSHTDINDENQTVHFPTIKTTATAENGKHIAEIPADAIEAKIIDKVEYTNLIPGETYKVSGTIHNVADNAPIKDTEGNVINVEKEFIPETANGFVEVEFVVPVDGIKGKNLVVFENLMYGKNTIAVHADPKDTDQTVTIPFIPYGEKIDASNYQPLKNAKFTIVDNGVYDFENHKVINKKPALEVQSVLSDENGHINFNALPAHHYTVQEIVAPDGYILDAHVYSVVVDKDGKLFTLSEKNELIEGLTIRNIHGGTVIISKTDLVSGRPVEGCEVVISTYVKKGLTEGDAGYMIPVNPDDKASMDKAGVSDISELEKVEVFRQTTDKKGRIYFFTDKPGKYFYRETKAANGYYLNEEEFAFAVGNDLSVKGDTHFTNIPYGTAVIRKVDKEGNPLKGCQISFYDENNRPLGSGISDERGRVYFVSPGPGKYYFVETKAPEGYALVKDHFHFEIDSDYKITGQLTFVNERIPGMSTKTGDTNNIGMWLILAATGIAGAGMVLCFANRKRKKTD